MHIYIITPEITMEDPEKAVTFNVVLKQYLEEYGISFYDVRKTNITKCKTEIDMGSLIIFFNDRVNKIDSNDDIYLFLKKAKELNSLIMPVAMDKDKRLPTDIVSEKQSYDVWEQLRCRNLNESYIFTLAQDFARKIIARVMPTVYAENGLIFVSHRRIDGEDITASLCDRILVQFKKSNLFRDVVNVEVGQDAQKEIDKAMPKSDAFIFIHTPKSAESDFINKELRFAISRNIPILWIQIDNADINKLKLKPTEKPHLKYSSIDFINEAKIIEISDEILKKTFELIMTKSYNFYDYKNNLLDLFDNNILEVDSKNMIYTIDVNRKGYKYPQRNIKQFIQLFGRVPTENDEINFIEFIKTNNNEYDSAIILTDRIIKSEYKEKTVIESYEDFIYHWNQYLFGHKEEKNMEIVISGAFPDCEEMYKQTLIDAIIIFAKSIIKDGYTLTFGSHPTFQELFFEISKDIFPDCSNKKLKMFISKWFIENYMSSKEYYEANALFFETESQKTLAESLTIMRKQMIQRKEVTALLCLGGKIKKKPLEEGIREEILLAQEYGIPVFVVGSVGGCSSKVAKEFRDNSWIELNDASSELNKEFMESVDYFTLSQKMLKHLDGKVKEISQ